MSPYITAVKAGAVYAIGMFSIGFAMGAIRFMFLLPLFGELAAIVIELPIMLVFSWLLCGRAILIWHVDSQTRIRAAMGATAFASLMVVDLGLYVLMFNSSPLEAMARWGTTAGAFGLAGQIVFGLLPLVRFRK